MASPEAFREPRYLPSDGHRVDYPPSLAPIVTQPYSHGLAPLTLPSISNTYQQTQHRPPTPAYPHYYTPSSPTNQLSPLLPQPVQGYPTDTTVYPNYVEDTVQIAPLHRPSFHHYHSSPQVPAVAAVPSQYYPSSSYPPPQRIWLNRHDSSPRMPLDGSYEPASPIQAHDPYFPPPFSSASSSSFSYPSGSAQPDIRPLLVKRESTGIQTGGESDRSWSGGDIPSIGQVTENQPWGIPQEIYKSLNPKDKKQIRNK